MIKGALPFFGHALALRSDPVGLFQRGCDHYGSIFSFRLFGERVNVLTGTAGNEAFFKAPDTVLSPREAYQFTVAISGKGVAYGLEPDLMDEQLRLVHPALRDDKMQSYARYMAEEMDVCLQRWGDSGEVDLLAAVNEFTMSAVARCLIGTEIRTELSREFVRLYHDLEGWMNMGLNMISLFAPNFPLPAMRRRTRARERFVELISGLIAARKRSKNESDDFLDTLMNVRDAHGRSLGDDIITGMLLTFLFAATPTTGVLASWTGVLLLQNRQHLARVMAEQQDVLGDGDISVASLKRLVLLDACIKETERLHPPMVMLMRKVLVELEFGGHSIPAGEWAMVSPALSHRMPGVFTDPSRYDPDRFLPGREEDRRAPYALIGFGGGKHRCIGVALAYQLVKVIWSVLLKRYDLTLIDPSPQPNYAAFLVGPRPPCRVSYRRRAVH